MEKFAFLKNSLVVKDSTIAAQYSIISEKDSVIAGLGSSISKITANLNAINFELEQFRRMIFGQVLNSLQLAHKF
jgi:hypothetical protein